MNFKIYELNYLKKTLKNVPEKIIKLDRCQKNSRFDIINIYKSDKTYKQN